MNNKKSLFYAFTCEYYSELASKSLDTELSTKELFFLKFHHVLCLLCRRCKTQIEAIDKACCSMSKNNEFNPGSKKLSEECKNKIKEEIV